jgi:hypothetical protein
LCPHETLGLAFFTEMSRTYRIPTDPIPKNPEKSGSRNTGTGVPSRNSKVGSGPVCLNRKVGISRTYRIYIILAFFYIFLCPDLFFSPTHSLFLLFLLFSSTFLSPTHSLFCHPRSLSLPNLLSDYLLLFLLFFILSSYSVLLLFLSLLFFFVSQSLSLSLN